YITDSSSEGTNALITVDLGSGAAWRHLVNIPAVEATEGFVPTIWGQPVYSNGTTGQPISNVNFGADGIALSADGATLYFSTTGGRRLYAVPTARLRDDGPNSEVLARASQVYLTGKGLTDGMESDSQDNIYMGNIEDNSISIYTPATGLLSTFVRDPRFSWTDTMSVAADGYLYFTENQLWRGAAYNGGVDKRVKPKGLRLHARPILLLHNDVVRSSSPVATDPHIDKRNELTDRHADDTRRHTRNHTDKHGDQDADEGANEGVHEAMEAVVVAMAVVVAAVHMRVAVRAEAVAGWDALDVGGEVGAAVVVGFVVSALKLGCVGHVGPAGNAGPAVTALAEGEGGLQTRELVGENAAPFAEERGESGAVFVSSIACGGVAGVGV
ncbi:MAG: hypothetical protein Q9157_003433, partial [Trypethelium eluteriae]